MELRETVQSDFPRQSSSSSTHFSPCVYLRGSQVDAQFTYPNKILICLDSNIPQSRLDSREDRTFQMACHGQRHTTTTLGHVCYLLSKEQRTLILLDAFICGVEMSHTAVDGTVNISRVLPFFRVLVLHVCKLSEIIFIQSVKLRLDVQHGDLCLSKQYAELLRLNRIHFISVYCALIC